MVNIIDGKNIAQGIRKNLKTKVDEMKKRGIKPKLAVIMVGEDKASKIYVRNKSRACEEVGISYEEIFLPQNVKMEELLEKIQELNNREDIHGILLQSPIPKQLDINQAFCNINYKKDVDGFNPINVGKLAMGEDCFISCTPMGIVRMLEEENIEIEGKHVVIIGRSNIVGKPLAQCMLRKNATVTICHSKTRSISDITSKADILIAALGKPNFVNNNMVKEGAVIVDVGINRTEDGKIVGDVDFDSVKNKAGYITPVPGGVGPMTIAMLMENVVKAADNN